MRTLWDERAWEEYLCERTRCLLKSAPGERIMLRNSRSFIRLMQTLSEIAVSERLCGFIITVLTKILRKPFVVNLSVLILTHGLNPRLKRETIICREDRRN